MEKTTSYRDLLVWQKGMRLVEECHRVTASLPRSEEFGLKAQIRRAAISIPSNIAEGHTRHHGREYVQFLFIASGSEAELERQVELAQRLKCLSMEEGKMLSDSCEEVGKMLTGLRKALSRYQQT